MSLEDFLGDIAYKVDCKLSSADLNNISQFDSTLSVLIKGIVTVSTICPNLKKKQEIEGLSCSLDNS